MVGRASRESTVGEAPYVLVLFPFLGEPAYNSGIRPGEVIVKVDERSTDGLTTRE